MNCNHIACCGGMGAPAWQVLAFGLVAALGAAGREALRHKAARVEARQTG